MVQQTVFYGSFQPNADTRLGKRQAKKGGRLLPRTSLRRVSAEGANSGLLEGAGAEGGRGTPAAQNPWVGRG